MNDIKLALLGSQGAGKSAVLVRFLTRRFIGEYASNANSLYHKRLSIDGRQLNLEVFDPCSQSSEARCILEEPVDWADGFVVVYNISDRFLLHRRQEHPVADPRGAHGKLQRGGGGPGVSGGEQAGLVSRPAGVTSLALFTQLIRQVMELLKYRADRRRYSGSKSMAKLINNVFGKRRKSV
ncbi:hypothetical protein KUCAC02_021444 [Chaenocephalus aceratus]|uniref:Uncharacterized protein n=1 Tax=Chaenocephalus aceratus TaxID=36190 RepID=A0ACB9XGN1_CHAAC|nr:hypothetical protein KUCAC02_021444 [Chaenocephalus aceratus]